MSRKNPLTEIKSEFENQTGQEEDLLHAGATLLFSTTTADCYSVRTGHRRLFVKVLKDPYRTNAIYRAAFAKEFEIGQDLNHASLPTYRFGGPTFIATDFIEGKTLAEMIDANDVRLHSPAYVHRILTDLVRVLNYLHNTRGVTHCDIKPDNILVSASTGMMTLIDFDKCHTDAMDRTSGAASRYGLAESQAGSADVDFHAVALLTELFKEKLPSFRAGRYKTFIKLCRTPGINAALLEEELKRIGKSKSNILPVTVIALTALLLVPVYLKIFSPAEKPVNVADETPRPVAPSVSDTFEQKLTTDVAVTVPLNETGGTLGLTDDVKSSDEIDGIVRNHFGELNMFIVPAQDILAANLDVPPQQIQELLRGLSRRYEAIYDETVEEIMEKNPALSPQDSQKLLETSETFVEIKETVSALKKALANKAEKDGAGE